MASPKTLPARSRLTAALIVALVVPGGTALAQNEDATTLDKVTVTGSLIPQSQVETFNPVTVITAENIQTRGFTNVADVLQQSTFQTGSVQGGQTSGGFTQGAEAAGMFGLDPGYTKYLINGRPMANYPALYNGSSTFNNISGIPIDLVERIEILPGGQSSLYGSDAIAGVVNIILKKQLDSAVISVRGGAYTVGGGDSVRFSLADSFSGFDGRLNVLAGVQYETRNPVWGTQRDLTKQFNVNGYTAPVASRDYMVYGYSDIANQDFDNYGYVFADPNNCANVTGQFGGTTDKRNRPGFGDYCGSFMSPGYRTLKSAKDSGQLYSHASFDVSDNFQLYGDLLYSNERVQNSAGSSYLWWGTGPKYEYFYDPEFDALVNLQRAFAPEDIGRRGYQDTMDTDTSNSYMVTLGGSGHFGNWDYDVGFTRTEYKLTERNFVRFADPINNYFANNVLGPQDGLDPYENYYPVFHPNYAAFYTPMNPADFASFTGHTNTDSRTWDNVLRAQVTNGSLFSLPGGDAGLAIVVEGGNQGWRYTPDARLIPDPVTGESAVWGLTSVSGSGHRSRYAVTSELRLPVWEPLTFTVSGRYDAFRVAGNTIDKPTYSLGVEYRPIESLLLRGKYGTAFRAPTLSDTFQGSSGYYNTVADYYRCSLSGYDAGSVSKCPYRNSQFFGEQSGNTALKPITADVWNAGVVWAPLSNLSFSVDYFRWNIKNEIDMQSADQLARIESFCRNGDLDINSSACHNATTWIVRDGRGEIESIYTPKVNVAQQKLEAVTASASYVQDIGRFGNLRFNFNYTNNLSHTVKPLPDSKEIDLRRDPYYMWVYSAEVRTRTDLSVGWDIDKWTTTVYANRIGSTPNYVAYLGKSFGYVNEEGAKAGWWDPYITYNMSVNYRAMENLQLSLMVNNLTNKMPKNQASSFPGTESEPYNSGVYDVYGRYVSLEVRYNFGAK